MAKLLEERLREWVRSSKHLYDVTTEQLGKLRPI